MTTMFARLLLGDTFLHGIGGAKYDQVTDSMKRAMDETLRRRAIQTAYNEENGITPESIVRPLDMTLAAIVAADYTDLTSGEAEGMPVDEFRKKFGEPDFEAQPFRPLAPGGENWGQFVLRVGTALDRILHEHDGKTIVLVCHGGIIDGSFLYFFKMSTWTPPAAG